jgi:hypothetical protein
MNSHVEWTPVVVAALVAWWVVVVSCGLVLRRTAPLPVTLDVTRMSRRSTRWTMALAVIWRALSWLAFLAAFDALSLRAARRAGRLERRGRPRARPVGHPGASAADLERTLASSPCSAPSLPPSAPRTTPALDFAADENTRRWERTLPWGTPSPLMTREGRARPYPFVPLAEPPSSGTVYRSPPRTPRRPPPPVTSLPVGPRKISM